MLDLLGIKKGNLSSDVIYAGNDIRSHDNDMAKLHKEHDFFLLKAGHDVMFRGSASIQKFKTRSKLAIHRGGMKSLPTEFQINTRPTYMFLICTG